MINPNWLVVTNKKLKQTLVPSSAKIVIFMSAYNGVVIAQVIKPIKMMMMMMMMMMRMMMMMMMMNEFALTWRKS